MKAGDLKRIVAEAMLVEPSKVWVTMRNLRENDLITTGARGVNAPDLTYRDAARVLLAHILDSNPGRAAPRYVRDFGRLPWANPAFAWEDDPFTLAELAPDSPTDTLEDAIAALIRVFAECRETAAFVEAGTRLRDGGFRNPVCRIEVFEEDAAATISMGAAHYAFNERPTSVRDWTPDQNEDLRLGRQAIAFVNQEVVARIADGFEGGQ
ncbi:MULTISPECIES: hypothetical protein [unclassified Mameliella]|uniref:hypothetical protein n=1 Tax=unclassified Mameliella TaxID=2630630 RepID=UPI00273D2C86|nr:MULTISPECIES: hypothetical protein [unclassified Mameliella]